MKHRDMIPRGKKTDVARPHEELRSWVESIDRVFDDLRSPIRLDKRLPPPLSSRFGDSDASVRETPKQFVVSAKLPGMNKKDIHVDVTADAVTIRAERKDEDQYRGKGGARGWSRSQTSYIRSFALPASVKPGHAKATYKDGVLTLEIPKAKETLVHQVSVD